MNPVKIIAAFLLVVLILNLVLFALSRISTFYFWVTIVVVGVIAFMVLPRMRNVR